MANIFQRSFWRGSQPIIRESSVSTTSSMITDINVADNIFYPLNFGIFHRYGLRTTRDITMALTRCDAITAIISQKAFQFTRGKVVLWNPKTGKPKAASGLYKGWYDLLRQPNKLETQRIFFIKAYSLMQMYGYVAIEPTYPVGFTDIPSSLKILWNNRIEWEQALVEDELPKRAWYTSMSGTRRELDVSKLIIIKDSGSLAVDEMTNLPLPRYSAMEQEISNMIASAEVRGEMQTDRGANGLISNSGKDAIGHVPIDPVEKENVQQAYRGYGNMSNQDKVIVTNAPLSYTPMTFDIKELGAHEETIAGLKSLCNRLGFPFNALAEGFEGKYNNSTNSRRDFQDTIIEPESMDFFEQLSLGLNMYSEDTEIYVDYSGIASLQASKMEEGQGMYAIDQAKKIEYDNFLITKNDWLEALGKDRSTNSEFDLLKSETQEYINSQALLNNNNTFGNGTGQSQST